MLGGTVDVSSDHVGDHVVDLLPQVLALEYPPALRVDHLARVRTYALGRDQPSARAERAQDLAQREIKIMCHVECVHGIDRGDAGRRDTLRLERAIHIEDVESHGHAFRPARPQCLLTAPEERRYELGEPILLDRSKSARHLQVLQHCESTAT